MQNVQSQYEIAFILIPYPYCSNGSNHHIKKQEQKHKKNNLFSILLFYVFTNILRLHLFLQRQTALSAIDEHHNLNKSSLDMKLISYREKKVGIFPNKRNRHGCLRTDDDLGNMQNPLNGAEDLIRGSY